LIIDDFSTDDTEVVGQRLAEQDRRIAFRRHSANLGHIATYNEGLLGWCSAEYSLLLSADDALAPGALARATALMDRHHDVGMTYGMAQVIGDTGTPTAAIGAVPAISHVMSGSQFLRFCCATGNPVPTPTAVVRTDLQHRLGGYRASLPHTGDMEMWMRFAVHASVGFVRGVQAYYRRHSRNMSSHYVSQSLRDYREVIDACEDALIRGDSKFSESPMWLELTYQRLAEKTLWLASAALDQGDSEGFLTCLRFAESIYPASRRSAVWWRLRAKRLLGQPLWHRLRSLSAPIRCVFDGASHSVQRQQTTPSVLQGRWPA
jgi:glycosyltransferase involved in cell wall biosynthesis